MYNEKFGEGNGNPPQCSCLENPREGGAWWSAAYGVTESQTRLKRLSSSSSSKESKGVPEKHLLLLSFIMLKPLTVWIATNCKVLQELGIPNHLTYLLRNLYTGQEATVKTLNETIDWLKIGKRVTRLYIVTLFI